MTRGNTTVLAAFEAQFGKVGCSHAVISAAESSGVLVIVREALICISDAHEAMVER